jgi:transcriptional regulator with XRE-family HTH domain
MDTVETLDAKFAKWIEEQCARPGFSRRELAAAMGVTEGVISKITNGIRQVKASEMELARRYFRADAVLQPGGGREDEAVCIVEAGVYRDDDAMRRAVVADPDFSPSNFPGFRLFAIVGDGMEALRPRPVSDGDYIVCSIPEKHADWVPDIEHGTLVVIDRAAAGHPGWERSLRQVDMRKGRGELHFRSRNEARQTPPIDLDTEADSLRLVGIVRNVIGRL